MTGETMATKIQYPKRARRMLQVRDCTVAICANNNPGSVLLSTFLFWYDHPRNGDVYDGDFFTICRTQAEIEEQACNQISVKTIHDAAVPVLCLLGYLDVQEKMNGNIYKINIKRIIAAFAAYDQGNKQLKEFIKSASQLENSLIEITPNELENSLINKRNLQLQLEKVLIRIRESSNCKRGRKPRKQATPDSEISSLENSRDLRDITNRECNSETPSQKPPQSAHAYTPTTQSTLDFPVVTTATGNTSNTKNTGKGKPGSQPVKPIIFLSEDEQRVYNWYCHIPQHAGIQPDINETLKKRMGQLVPLVHSQEEMNELYNYTRAQPFMRGKGIQPGNLVKYGPAWRSTLPEQQTDAPTTNDQPDDENQLILWTRHPWDQFDDLLENYWYRFEYMTLAEARQYEYDTYGPMVPKQRREIEQCLKEEAEGKKQRPLVPVA
jgi:hypothetical protein